MHNDRCFNRPCTSGDDIGPAPSDLIPVAARVFGSIQRIDDECSMRGTPCEALAADLWPPLDRPQRM